MSVLNRNLTAAVAIVLVCLVTSVASAQFERDPAVIRGFEAGEAARAAEDWEAAIEAYGSAIALDDGTFAELYFGNAEALRELEDFQSAIASYQKALQANDAYAQAYNGRGICHREQQNLQLALNDFNNAAELDRRDPAIAANLGDILVNNAQDPTQAMIYLDRALELDPENAEAYRNRGWAHTLLREPEDAIADLEKSIELDPEDYETYQRLASVHLIEKEYQSAIEALTKTIEHYEPKDNSEPDTYINGYLQRANTRMQLAKEADQTAEQRESLYDAIVADVDTILGEFPDRFPESGSALFLRGMALRMKGLFAEAITALTDALQLIPSGTEGSYTGEAYRVRGICWFYQGQNNLARGDFKEAASLVQEDPLPHLWIGYTHAEEEEYRKAIESYGEAISKNPSFSLAHVNKGLAYVQLEDYGKAIDNFNEAIRAEPTEPKHFYKRGRAHEMLGEWQKALDSYELALLRDGDFADAHRGAARALRELGRPNLADIHENKANVLP